VIHTYKDGGTYESALKGIFVCFSWCGFATNSLEILTEHLGLHRAQPATTDDTN
jgi:hypothetical protein